GAPINYQKHIDESNVDDGIVSQRPITNIWDWGMFLKSNSSLVGASEGVALRFVENRNDHEVELAVIIGKAGTNITAENALDHVAGYAIGLDMTTRGKELQSFRKSSDSYSVLGPWMVTKDEIEDPNSLDLNISVNGEERQSSNTDQLVYNVQQCIEYTTTRYTVYPGDIIMTGTPEGVGPVEPGDIMTAEIEKIGKMEVAVRAA
ncbi:MAG: fumarylacetoacetate hydrolase family protein, partial [Rhodospirillaceae bacterium]|nr:fumarylacetoacetate hydrolase family protein [Rhodospirillaceae bacterium]